MDCCSSPPSSPSSSAIHICWTRLSLCCITHWVRHAFCKKKTTTLNLIVFSSQKRERRHNEIVINGHTFLSFMATLTRVHFSDWVDAFEAKTDLFSPEKIQVLLKIPCTLLFLLKISIFILDLKIFCSDFCLICVFWRELTLCLFSLYCYLHVNKMFWHQARVSRARTRRRKHADLRLCANNPLID